MAPRAPSRHALAAMALACALVAATAFVRITDPDVFWHLKAGELLAATRAIPRTDPFSYTAPGPWSYLEVLTELAFHAAHRALGFAGLQLLTALVVAATGAAVAWRVRAGSRTASAAFVAVILWGAASAYRFGPKTELFSLLATATLLALVDAADRAGRAAPLWAVPPLMLLWANLHRGGTLGLALLGASLVGFALVRERRRLVLPCAAVLAASTVALLANPAGLGYVTAAFELASRTSYARHLPEWARPGLSFYTTVDPEYALMLALYLPDLRGARARPREALTTVSLVALGLVGVRFVPLAAIAIAPGVARTVDALLDAATRRMRAGTRPEALGAVLAALAAIVAVVRFLAVTPPALRGLGLAPHRVPIAAADFLGASPPPGRMWNHFNLGGYFVWALAPKQKVFIDGRNDTVYPDAFFDRAVRAAREPAILEEDLATWDVGFVVMASPEIESPKLAPLLAGGRFQLVFMDDVAAVAVRARPESAAYLEAHAYRELSPVDGLRRAQAPRAADPRRAAFEAEADRFVREAPSSVRAQLVAAAVDAQRGRAADAAAHEAEANRLALERGWLDD